MGLHDGAVIAGRYRVTRKLGAGGMGAVYLAEQVSDGRPCVIKTITGKWGGNPASRKRFAREAEAASLLDHPGIVRIIELDAESDEPFIAMEHLDGRTLTEVIHEPGPMRVDRAVAIVKELLDALTAAHARGIVHRDLKPSNVMLVPDGGGGERVKVLDFGIARIFDEVRRTRLTQTGQVVGTPGFLAPEQAKGDPVDARTDLFAVGVILYVMLTEHLPFRGRDTSARLIAMLTEPPVPLSRERPDVSEQIGAVIMRTLEKDPNDRFSSARELAEALDDALAGRLALAVRTHPALPASPTRAHAAAAAATAPASVPATDVAKVRAATDVAKAPVATDVPKPPPPTGGGAQTEPSRRPSPRPAKRPIGLFALAAIAFVLLGGLAAVGVVVFLGSEGEPPPETAMAEGRAPGSAAVPPVAFGVGQVTSAQPMNPSAGDPGLGLAPSPETETEAEAATETETETRTQAEAADGRRGERREPEGESPSRTRGWVEERPGGPTETGRQEDGAGESGRFSSGWVLNPELGSASPTMAQPTPAPRAPRNTNGVLRREGNPMFLREIEREEARDWVDRQLGVLTPCFRTMQVDSEQAYTIRVDFRQGEVWNPHSNSAYLSQPVRQCIHDALDDRPGFEHGSFGFRVRWRAN